MLPLQNRHKVLVLGTRLIPQTTVNSAVTSKERFTTRVQLVYEQCTCTALLVLIETNPRRVQHKIGGDVEVPV